MKAIRIWTIAALLLCAGGINGGSFPAYMRCNYDVTPYNKPDSLYLAVYDSANTKICDTGWGMTAPNNDKSITTDSLADGSYGFRFVSSTPGFYNVYGKAWKDGELEPVKYTVQIGMDVTSISGDRAATDNFETMLDGTGGATLSLRRLKIVGISTTDTAIIAQGGTASGGIGLYASGYNSGMTLMGTGTAATGLYAGVTTGNYGAWFSAGTGGTGLFASATGTGSKGFRAYGLTGILAEGITYDWQGEFDTSNFTNAVATEFQGSASLTYDGIANAWGNKAQSGFTTPGTFGYYLDKQVSGVTATVSTADKGEIAGKAKDSVWRALRSDYGYTDGRFGYYLDQQVSNQASPPEVLTQAGSALTSWATSYDPATGTDLFTTGVKVANLPANIIQDTTFKPGAITASALAADALTSSELATSAVTEITDAIGTVSTDTTVIKALATNNPSLFYGPGVGSGTNSVRIYAIDTSGTDAAVSSVTLTVRNSSDVLEGVDQTNSSGYATFNLNNGTWKVLAQASAYQWATAKTIAVTTAQYDSIKGYDIAVTAPSGCSTATVYGYVYNILGQAVENSTVTASLPGQGNRDTCCNTILDGYVQSTVTNSAGYWSLELVRSACVDGNGTYIFKAAHPSGRVLMSVQKTVPDSTSYRLTW